MSEIPKNNETLDNLKLLEKLQENSFSFNLEKTENYIKYSFEDNKNKKILKTCCSDINIILNKELSKQDIKYKDIYNKLESPIWTI